MNIELIAAHDGIDMDQAIVELDDLELTLIGGGIGETILVNPTK